MNHPFEAYRVGGCVRDHLLGKEVKDVDWVVVGSTPEQMLSLGYRQVGKDFPVFLHPETNEEYALARLERKTGIGYNGFSVDIDKVTLEEDLSRRDLTINAMAMDENGNIIDPFDGLSDLKNKILRHVGEAFSEDPLRIVRLARFAARYNFSIHQDTLNMCRGMVANGVLSEIPAERYRLESEKAMTDGRFGSFLASLDTLQATNALFGTEASHKLKNIFKIIDNSALSRPDLSVACFLYRQGLGDSFMEIFLANLNDVRIVEKSSLLLKASQLDISDLHDVFVSCDVSRRKADFQIMVEISSFLAELENIDFNPSRISALADVFHDTAFPGVVPGENPNLTMKNARISNMFKAAAPTIDPKPPRM